MSDLLSRYMNGTDTKTFPASIRKIYRDKLFSKFTVCKIVEAAPTITLIEGVMIYQENGCHHNENTTARIIAETSEGDMALRISNETVWRVMDMNLVEVKHI